MESVLNRLANRTLGRVRTCPTALIWRLYLPDRADFSPASNARVDQMTFSRFLE
jgi:hypothetical protein